ncbi:MAG: hypothetical protein ACTHN8_17940, partial [Angustibacter sp.]
MPLRVTPPPSRRLAVWRAPLWQRVVFPLAGIAMLVGAFWPWADEATYRPLWIGALAGAGLIGYALRPKLSLYEDALWIRGHFLSRVIPIEQIAVVEAGYSGLNVFWGDDGFSQVPAIGEQTNIEGLPGSDRRRHDIRGLILETRDAYLRRHGLAALPDPRKEQERRAREARARGLVESNPRIIRKPPTPRGAGPAEPAVRRR